MSVEIELKNVTKQFTTKKLGTITAVNNINLQVMEGECLSFLGPSGCGKTTTLRMIAGFEDLTEGEIYLSGKPVSIRSKRYYVPPEDRGLGMVFQAFAVWPHLTVFDNVAFPLQVQKLPKAEIRERTLEAMKHASLSGLENVYPDDLSGGQQQRIALARAIVTQPRVMLLDEPLSNLDPQLRESMRFEIKQLQEEFGFTIIFVTHDQSEAMALSDRILVMDMGEIVQVGKPEELYMHPANRFVHSFLGESSFVKTEIKNGKAYVKGAEDKPLPIAPPSDNEEDELWLATRPNTIEINHEEGYPGRILTRTFLTGMTQYLVGIGDETVMVETPHRVEFKEGDPCYLKFPSTMWYPVEAGDAEAERQKRQLV